MATTQRTVTKRTRGRTSIADTPIAIRSRISIDADLRAQTEERLRRALSSLGPRIERASVRFEDLNGPRGGVDTVCRVKLVFSGGPSVQVEERGIDAAVAMGRAVRRVAHAARRRADRDGGSAPAATHEPVSVHRAESRPFDAAVDTGSVIGRRVGRARVNLDSALERPEKLRRDAYVNTAEVGRSATDRKAGGSVSARRNARKSADGMVSTLEDSRDKPSRKSTRRSSNRSLGATQLTRRTKRALATPGARAARSRAGH